MSAKRITVMPADISNEATALRAALVRAPLAGDRFRQALKRCDTAGLEEAAMLTVATSPWRARVIGAEIRRRRNQP